MAKEDKQQNLLWHQGKEIKKACCNANTYLVGFDDSKVCSRSEEADKANRAVVDY